VIRSFFPFLYRIADKEVQVSQGVSLTAGSQALPIRDDILTSKMMKIEDLIECAEVFF
jgi:hypothetical protein